MKRTILIVKLKQSFFSKTCHETLGISWQKLSDVFGVDNAILDDNKDGIIYNFVWKSAKNRGEPAERQMRLFKVLGSSGMTRLEFKSEASNDFRNLVREGKLKEVDSVCIDIIQQDNGEKAYYFDYIMPTDVIVFKKDEEGENLWTRLSDRYSSSAFNDLLNTELKVYNTDKKRSEVIKFESKADKYSITIYKNDRWVDLNSYSLLEFQITKAGIKLRNRNSKEVRIVCIQTGLCQLEE